MENVSMAPIHDFNETLQQLQSYVNSLHENLRALAQMVFEITQEKPEWKDELIKRAGIPARIWNRLLRSAENKLDERLILGEKYPSAVHRLPLSEQQLLLDGEVEMLCPETYDKKRIGIDDLCGNSGLTKQLINYDQLRNLGEQRTYLETLPLKHVKQSKEPCQAGNWDVIGRGKKAKVEIYEPVRLNYKELAGMMERLSKEMER